MKHESLEARKQRFLRKAHELAKQHGFSFLDADLSRAVYASKEPARYWNKEGEIMNEQIKDRRYVFGLLIRINELAGKIAHAAPIIAGAVTSGQHGEIRHVELRVSPVQAEKLEKMAGNLAIADGILSELQHSVRLLSSQESVNERAEWLRDEAQELREVARRIAQDCQNKAQLLEAEAATLESGAAA